MASGIHHWHPNGTVDQTPVNGNRGAAQTPQVTGSLGADHINVAATNGQTGSTNAQNGFRLGDFSVDEGRPMKVIVIGAGMSGILAGIRCHFCFIFDILYY